MVTEDLIVYIQGQLRKNVSKDIIASRLASVGWHASDIDEGLRKVSPPSTPINKTEISQVKPTNTPVFMSVKQMPLSSPPTINYQPVKPVFAKSFSDANNTKPITSSTSINPVTPINKIIPPIKIDSTGKVESSKEELIPTLNSKVIVPTPPPQIASTPTISVEQKVEQQSIKNDLSFLNQKTTTESKPSILETEDHVPNGAMISSYRSDLLSVNQGDGLLPKKKRKNIFKWLILVITLFLIGGVVFAITQDYIKIPKINFSFIKKDPKDLLINAPIDLAGLTSYKTETIVSVTFPEPWTVASGLLTGEAMNDINEANVKLSSVGMVNNNNSGNPTFDYATTINSSLFKNKLLTNFKHSGSNSIIKTPDLSELLGENAPPVSNVSVDKGEFDSFLDLFSVPMKISISQLDIDKVFVLGVPSYINNETASIFKNFINNASVVEKPEEEIRGVMSYHYQFNFDAQSSRKFLEDFINVFFTSDTLDEDKDLLRDRLSALSLDSLDVWIGKDDSKIRQYSFSVKSPLSRLIDLEDKGIAGNEVRLTWQTTYYDFGVANDISMPEDTIKASVFITEVKDMKIKNKMIKFKPLADNFKNLSGNYGTRGNPTGSCMAPNPSSLYSPVGHLNKASTSVGEIASFMNDLLGTTNGALSCYSTSTDWAMATPLISDPVSSFCVDSYGREKVISIPLAKSSCE